jgi:hypothetical protein
MNPGDDEQAKARAYAQQQTYAHAMVGADGGLAGYPHSYIRSAALATAIQFNNGVGVDAAKIVVDARAFLAFLQDG